jgi:hypothetical protein
MKRFSPPQTFSPRRALLVAAGLVVLFVTTGGDVVTRSAAARQPARLGREFRIGVGRAATFGREDLRVRLVSVESDSRCPVNVACVWAGNAEVLVEVGAKNGRGGRTLRLNTSASPERPAEGRFGRYTVRLVGLTPQPATTRKIRAREYTAALLVTKD